MVDVAFVRAQGGPGSPRAAVRRYVRGGFQTGFSLNPLFSERLVSSQLSDAGRVPALYAYVVNDVSQVDVSPAWDAVQYARREPAALSVPGGPLGHAWRQARDAGHLDLGIARIAPTVRVPFSLVHERALAAVDRTPSPQRPTGDSSPITVVCRLAEDEGIPERPLGESAEAAMRLSAGLRVALADVAADVRAAVALMQLWLPRVDVEADSPTLLEQMDAAAAPGDSVVVRGPHAEITAGDLIALARLGAERATAPLWLGWDGTVASAGVVVGRGRAFNLLQGHPAEDAHVLGELIETWDVAGETFARPLGTNRKAGACTALSLTVRAPARGSVAQMVDADDTDLDALLRPALLSVGSWTDRGPRLERARRSATLPDGSRVPALRWAIKIAAPPGPPGEAWGDTHFARGIRDALVRLGQEVVIDAYDARRRASSYLDDVVLALRGPEPLEPQQGAISLLWIISHPDEIDAAAVHGFDRVFAASSSWAARASEQLGTPVTPLLQCTDAHRFRPAGRPRSEDLVFVGTARGIARPSVVEPIRAGIPVSVYGPDWRGYIPASSIASTGIPNAELPAVYETAGAVLNDHWPAMRERGFISNRLFDVVAAGGRAISDDVSGITAIFSGAVREYRSIPELLSLLGRPLDDLFPSEDELRRVSARVRSEHSFDARARMLLDVALERRQTSG